MARGRKYVTWTWLEDGKPAYVGWGKFDRVHPAKALWARRRTVRSPLTDWLCDLDAEPERDGRSSSLIAMSQTEASAIAVVRRAKLTAAGFELYSSRPDGTWSGGGTGRPVLGPDYQYFDSVREAAACVGVNPSTITRWCATDDSEWDYLHSKKRIDP